LPEAVKKEIWFYGLHLLSHARPFPRHDWARDVPAHSRCNMRRIQESFDERILAWHNGKLWQRQYYDHIIRNREDFDETLNYIHLNPVRRGLVERAEDWPYTERLDYLHLVAKAMTARAGTAPTE